MHSRKKQNLEVERKLKRQRKAHLAVFAALCLVVVIVISWVVWDTQNRRFIMTFNGERVLTNDFLLMSVLTDQPINDFTRYVILDDLLRTLTLLDMGERYGVGFTPEERAENESVAAMWLGMFEQEAPGMFGFIDPARMGEFIGLDEQVVPRLVDLLITEYELDEDEFEEVFEMHVEWLIEQGTEVFVKYMAQDTSDSHQDAVIELTANDDFDFDDIASRHCVLQTGLEPITLQEFEMRFNVHVDDWLAGLPIGQYSPTFSPLQHGTEYYINFYVYDRVPPELDLVTIERELRDDWIQHGKMSTFFELLPGWIADAEYELNLRVFDTIS